MNHVQRPVPYSFPGEKREGLRLTEINGPLGCLIVNYFSVSPIRLVELSRVRRETRGGGEGGRETTTTINLLRVKERKDQSIFCEMMHYNQDCNYVTDKSMGSFLSKKKS